MKRIYMLAVVLLAVSGCASVPDLSPEDLARLPVVAFGEPVPKDKAFILHFPAGQPISTAVTISGNLFEREARQNLTVALRKDIYTYKEWISFDRKIWVDGRKAIVLKVGIQSPGYDHPEPGFVRIEMDEKKAP
jgi:hypothetical protein